MKRSVAVYRSALLPKSEPFVRDHVMSLSTYASVLIGAERVSDGIPANELGNHYCLADSVSSASLKMFKMFGRSRVLESFIDEFKPSLMHAHFGPNAVDILKISRRRNIPLLVTFHGYDATTDDAYFVKRIGGIRYLINRQRLFDQATHFFAVSRFIKDKMIELGCSPTKVTVHYLGLPLSKLLSLNKECAKSKEPTVIFVGRLIDRKGLRHLIHALGHVQSVVPDIRLNIIGDGPERSALEKLASKTLRDYCFYGARSQEFVFEKLAQAHVFSMPAHHEGFGMVYLEAQALGVPIVAFDNRPIDEVMIDGVTGFLVPDKDIVALANRILLLVQDQDLHHKMSLRAREWVATNFSIEKQSAGLERLYDGFVERHECKQTL